MMKNNLLVTIFLFWDREIFLRRQNPLTTKKLLLWHKKPMKTKLLSLIFFALGAGNIFAQPSNNTCSGVITLAVNGPCDTRDVTGATQDLAPTTCTVAPGGYANDVWYKFI